MSRSQHIEPQTTASDKMLFWLTPDCERLQCELLDLVGEVGADALALNPTTSAECLRRVRSLRDRWQGHIGAIEGPGGLFRYVEEGAPQSAPELGELACQHRRIGIELSALENHLTDVLWEKAGARDASQACAGRIGDLLYEHQLTALQLVADTHGDPQRMAPAAAPAAPATAPPCPGAAPRRSTGPGQVEW